MLAHQTILNHDYFFKIDYLITGMIGRLRYW